VQEAVAALARHVCLKAPDRAEPRANAVRAAAAMAPLLSQWEQDQFVGFVFNLSRSSKASRRGGGKGCGWAGGCAGYSSCVLSCAHAGSAPRARAGAVANLPAQAAS
jgi:hypothetical protein